MFDPAAPAMRRFLRIEEQGGAELDPVAGRPAPQMQRNRYGDRHGPEQIEWKEKAHESFKLWNHFQPNTPRYAAADNRMIAGPAGISTV